MTTAANPVTTVGRRLVELCQAGENRRAIEELYADEVEVVEAMPMEGQPNGTRSRDAILAASDWFFENMEIHSASCEGPFPQSGDRFICFMQIDLTPREGPMSGQRMKMSEAAVYDVKGGKIVRSEFCYEVPG